MSGGRERERETRRETDTKRERLRERSRSGAQGGTWRNGGGARRAVGDSEPELRATAEPVGKIRGVAAPSSGPRGATRVPPALGGRAVPGVLSWGPGAPEIPAHLGGS